MLSSAEKMVMIKFVLQSRPTYVMGCLRVPKNICNQLSACLRKFWWNNNDTANPDKRTINWEKWMLLCHLIMRLTFFLDILNKCTSETPHL